MFVVLCFGFPVFFVAFVFCLCWFFVCCFFGVFFGGGGDCSNLLLLVLDFLGFDLTEGFGF